MTVTSCKSPAMDEIIHHIIKRLNLNPRRWYVPQFEEAQRTRDDSVRASLKWYCSNPVMNVCTLRSCGTGGYGNRPQRTLILVKKDHIATNRDEGCILPQKALSASSPFANSGTETVPAFASSALTGMDEEELWAYFDDRD